MFDAIELVGKVLISDYLLGVQITNVIGNNFQRNRVRHLNI